MDVPKSVQEAVKRADQARQQRYGNPDAPAPADNEPAPAPAAPEAKETAQVAVDPFHPDKPVPIATPDTKAEQPVDKRETVGYWRHRYDVIQGKYNAEVPTLQKQVRELKTEIENLKAKPQDHGNVVKQLHDLTEEEIEEFGPDLVKFVEKIVKRSTPAAPAASTQDTESLDQRLAAIEREREEDAKATFWMKLEKAHSDFREVNSSPEFIAFLMAPADDGRQRQAHLTEAQRSWNYQRVIEIFDAFKESVPPVPPKRDIPPEHVEPPHARGDAGAIDEAPVWTREAIKAFYRDLREGKYTKAEALALETQIFEAQRAGKVF